ncbi:MAG: GNAT family N-acetyltransferase [Myxococcota bacterium]|nr:GNAT family N-acetyltransferase [Myxococcota bacterium]
MIRLLTDTDFAALFGHMCRHGDESGRNGDVIFRPRSQHEVMDEVQISQRHRGAWGRGLDQPLWLRTWGVFVDNAIVGHLDLNGGRLPAELHRATLGMGIERRARKKGFGRELLETAIAWARVNKLAWIDLGVFAHNEIARALYKSVGFVETGLVKDQFRVDGIKIDDVSMSLALRVSPSATSR